MCFRPLKHAARPVHNISPPTRNTRRVFIISIVMDKWLKGHTTHTIPTSLIEENVDDPEPFIVAGEQQATTIAKKKKVVRHFNDKWVQMPAYKNWLTNKINLKEKDMVYCKVCSSYMSPHLTEIKRHGQSAKHTQHANQVLQQNSVSEVFKITSLTEKTRIAELKLAALFVTKNLSFSLSDTLTPLLSSIFPDSKITKNMTLKRTKTTSIMKNVIGKNFLQELCDSLKQPGSFYSLIMDESTDISEIKQSAFVIIYFDTNATMVKTQFLDMVETVSGKSYNFN